MPEIVITCLAIQLTNAPYSEKIVGMNFKQMKIGWSEKRSSSGIPDLHCLLLLKVETPSCLKHCSREREKKEEKTL